MDNINRIQELTAFFDRAGFPGCKIIEMNQMVRYFIPTNLVSGVFAKHIDELAYLTSELGYMIFTIHPTNV